MIKSRFLAVFMMLVLALTSLSIPVFAQHNYAVMLSTVEDTIDNATQYIDVVINSFASGCGDEEFMTMAAIDEEDTLWMWGDNSYGKCLSIGDRVETPTKVMYNVKQIAIGENHVAVIKTDNTLWTWGRNNEGQLGNGSLEDATIPKQIMTGVKSVVAGPDYTMALKNTNYLYGFGLNSDSQFAYGYSETKDKNAVSGANGYSIHRLVTPIVIAKDVVDMSAGKGYSIVVTSDGTVYGAGRNGNGQLGAGVFTVAGTADKPTYSGGYIDMNNAVPAKPNLNNEKAVKVSTGDSYTMIVTENGALWGFGKSFYGQMGENSSTGIGLAGTTIPVKIMTSGVADVFCGDTCSIVLTTDGRLVQLGGPDKGFINNTAASSTQFKTGISQISNTGLPMTLDTNGSLYLIDDKILTEVDIKVPYEGVTEIKYNFEDGGRITVYVGGDKEIDGGVFLIAFYRDNVLKSAIKQPVNQLGDAITFSPPADTDRCRIFLFKDIETIEPLAEDKGFDLINSSNVTATAVAATVPGYDTTYNVTVVVGLSGQSFANVPVTLTVVPDNAESEVDLFDAAYIYQGFTGADSIATITFPIHCDCEGLKVCVNVDGIYLGETHITELK